MTISRPGVAELIEYEITRDKIPIYSVDVNLMLNNKSGSKRFNFLFDFWLKKREHELF